MSLIEQNYFSLYDNIKILVEERRVRVEDSCILLPFDEIQSFLSIIKLDNKEDIDCVLSNEFLCISLRDIGLDYQQINYLEFYWEV